MNYPINISYDVEGDKELNIGQVIAKLRLMSPFEITKILKPPKDLGLTKVCILFLPNATTTHGVLFSFKNEDHFIGLSSNSRLDKLDSVEFKLELLIQLQLINTPNYREW